MSHPFFNHYAYPWDRPEARELHKALSAAISQPDRIDKLYRQFGASLPPLPLSAAADDIWKHALEALSTASVLAAFCEYMLQQEAYAALHGKISAITNAGSSAPMAMPLSENATVKLFESLTRMRAELPGNLDRVFAAQRLNRRVRVDPPDAYMETTETLLNVGGQPCSEVVRIVVSDTPTEFKHLRLKAEIEACGQAPFLAGLKADPSKDRRMFRITVSFKGHVVAPLDTITIRWSCVVPGSVMRDDDYWVFPHFFKDKVKELTLEVAFEQEPSDVHLFRDQYDTAAQREHLEPISLSRPRTERTPNGSSLVVYSLDREEDAGMYLFTWNV